MAASKRMKAIQEKVDPNKTYSAAEGVALLLELTNAQFVESVEAAVVLGVDPRKSDQNVRGTSQYKHGTGKTARVAVFGNPDEVDAALKAGADAAGMDELAQAMRDGDLNYDVVIASPSSMPVVGKLGTLLGPKGLMPNPKVGTVTTDVAAAVKRAKAGEVRFRTDKGGIIHTIIGKADFKAEQLLDNLSQLIADLKRLKPSSAKGQYVQRVSLSTSMGPGLRIDVSSIS